MPRKYAVSAMRIGSDDERHERETPVQDQHRDRDQHDHGDVAEDGDHAARDHLGERVDVVRDPRHQPADRVAVEERQRQELQVAEQLEAQVVHRALPDPGREERLPVADARAGGEHDEIEDAERREPPERLVARERPFTAGMTAWSTMSFARIGGTICAADCSNRSTIETPTQTLYGAR